LIDPGLLARGRLELAQVADCVVEDLARLVGHAREISDIRDVCRISELFLTLVPLRAD
jgi:hypothetical protein